jgi:hypothetical protein
MGHKDGAYFAGGELAGPLSLSNRFVDAFSPAKSDGFARLP